MAQKQQKNLNDGAEFEAVNDSNLSSNSFTQVQSSFDTVIADGDQNSVVPNSNNAISTATQNNVALTDFSATNENSVEGNPKNLISTDSNNVISADSQNVAPLNNSLTTAQSSVDEILDELATEPPVHKQRIWEIDFFRGFLILFVIWDHLMFDIVEIGGAYQTGFFKWLYSFAYDYFYGSLREACHDAFVTLFIFLSGVSCSFSKNNGKRAIKMIIFAILLTTVTYSVSQLFHVTLTIYFNVIHVIALSVLLWTVIEFFQKKCTKPWQKNVFGAVMVAVIVASLVVGASALEEPIKSTNSLFYFLVQHNYYVNADFFNYCQVDYWPFLPDFGWFLIGAFLGQIVYKQRKTLFPSVNPKYVRPVMFCGRYSIWIYFGSQVIMYGIIYLLHVVLNWL